MHFGQEKLDYIKRKSRLCGNVKWLEEKLMNCHPTNVRHFKQRLEHAKENIGSTLFDWLIEIINEHEDIELRLE